jgi:hypothetical protein
MVLPLVEPKDGVRRNIKTREMSDEMIAALRRELRWHRRARRYVRYWWWRVTRIVWN